MKDLAQRAGIDFAVRPKLHKGFHPLGPLVVDLGAPQFVPSLLVVDLGVEEELKTVREGGDLGDARGLNFADKLRPDIVVVPLVLGERAGFQAQGKGAPNQTGILFSLAWFHWSPCFRADS